MDGVANGAYSKLASGIALGATSFTVLSGDGAKFTGTVPYNLSIRDARWSSWAEANANGEAEIVRVTVAPSGDTFPTIIRAQESTTAKNFNVTGRFYIVEQNITAGLLTSMKPVSPWGGQAGGGLASNQTNYISPFSSLTQTSANEFLAQIPVTRPGTFNNLLINIYRATNNNSAKFTATWRKNLSDTILTCQAGPAKAGAAAASDLVNSFTVVSGDLVDVKVVGDGSGSTCDYLGFNTDFTPL